VGNDVVKYFSGKRVKYIPTEKFTSQIVAAIRNHETEQFRIKYRGVDVLIVDDVQFLAGKEKTQEEFFHTFNELHQTNKQIVITSDRPPKSIPAMEKRLLSRFEWGMIADIIQPNVETRLAILDKKCREKNYSLSEEILAYIANNISNNIRELEGALNRIIAYHEFNNTTPTIETTKAILNDLMTNLQLRSLSPKDILEAVARFYNLSTKDLTGQGRRKELVWPRQIAIFLMREETNTSYPTIGQELGGRDHTTAMHAYNKILREVKEKGNEKIKQEIESIKQILYNTCL